MSKAMYCCNEFVPCEQPAAQTTECRSCGWTQLDHLCSCAGSGFDSKGRPCRICRSKCRVTLLGVQVAIPMTKTFFRPCKDKPDEWRVILPRGGAVDLVTGELDLLLWIASYAAMYWKHHENARLSTNDANWEYLYHKVEEMQKHQETAT